MYVGFFSQGLKICSDTISRIRQHLRRLGWGEELDLLPSWDVKPENIPIVERACRKELTDSGQSILLLLGINVCFLTRAFTFYQC